MNLLQQLEIIEACQAGAGIANIDDPNVRSNIVRMVARAVMKLERIDIQEANVRQEVKDALLEFQEKIRTIEVDILLSKYNLCLDTTTNPTPSIQSDEGE